MRFDSTSCTCGAGGVDPFVHLQLALGPQQQPRGGHKRSASTSAALADLSHTGTWPAAHSRRSLSFAEGHPPPAQRPRSPHRRRQTIAEAAAAYGFADSGPASWDSAASVIAESPTARQADAAQPAGDAVPGSEAATDEASQRSTQRYMDRAQSMADAGEPLARSPSLQSPHQLQRARQRQREERIADQQQQSPPPPPPQQQQPPAEQHQHSPPRQQLWSPRTSQDGRPQPLDRAASAARRPLPPPSAPQPATGQPSRQPSTDSFTMCAAVRSGSPSQQTCTFAESIHAVCWS